MKKIFLIILLLPIFSCAKKPEDFIESQTSFLKNSSFSPVMHYAKPSFKRYIDLILLKKIFKQENTREVSIDSIFEDNLPVIMISTSQLYSNAEKFMQHDYKIIMMPFLQQTGAGLVSGKKFKSSSRKTKLAAVENTLSEQYLKLYLNISNKKNNEINYIDDDELTEFLKGNPDSVIAVDDVAKFKNILLSSKDVFQNFPVLIAVKSDYLFLFQSEFEKMISDIMVINEDCYKLNSSDFHNKYKFKKEDLFKMGIYPLGTKNNMECFSKSGRMQMIDENLDILFYDKLLGIEDNKSKLQNDFKDELKNESLNMKRELLTFDLPFNRQENDFFQKAYFELYSMEKILGLFVNYEISVTYYPGSGNGYSDYYFKEAYSKYYLNVYKKEYFSKLKFNYMSPNAYRDLEEKNRLPQNDKFVLKILLPEL